MHSAPSVTYPVGRCRLALVVIAFAWVAGAAALGAWVWEIPGGGWRQGSAALALAGTGLLACWSWTRSAQGSLAWDGDTWRWEAAKDAMGEPATGAAREGTVSLILDVQSVLLLLWKSEQGSVAWLWLERNRSPGPWEALRRAVYSRAGAPAPPRALPLGTPTP